MKLKRSICTVLVAVSFTILGSAAVNAQSKSAKLEAKSIEAYNQLLAKNEAATKLSKVAKGVLVFPSVKKAGFMIGGQSGEGTLRVGGKTEGFYKTTAASFGLQAGGQKFGYAMFFMTPKALEYLRNSKGWEVGVGPTLTVVDEGVARSLTTSSARDDIYVFFFNQKGLMGGLGIQGSKISKIDPDK
jgi:lipid-binding SYLF domain-containing protein